MKIRSKNLATLSLLGLFACTLTPPPQIDDWLTRAAEFAATNPADIAVLAVEDATGAERLQPHLAFLRRVIQENLVQRNYSPLSTTYVDAHMRRGAAEAAPGAGILAPTYLSSLANKADEDAILAVQVSTWDDSSLLVDSRVRFEAAVTLLGSKDRKVLWTGGLRGVVVAGGERAAPRDPNLRAQAAAREFAKELIGRLPRRRI